MHVEFDQMPSQTLSQKLSFLSPQSNVSSKYWFSAMQGKSSLMPARKAASASALHAFQSSSTESLLLYHQVLAQGRRVSIIVYSRASNAFVTSVCTLRLRALAAQAKNVSERNIFLWLVFKFIANRSENFFIYAQFYLEFNRYKKSILFNFSSQSSKSFIFHIWFFKGLGVRG